MRYKTLRMSVFRSIFALLAGVGLAACGPKPVDNVARIAVATNFLETAKALEIQFETASEHEIMLVAGSTGKLYAQIALGAPFHAFLSADRDRPARLVDEDLATGQFTYAMGVLAAWSPDGDAVTGDLKERLQSGAFDRIAIANPDLAPYGAAAIQVLEGLDALAATAGKRVRGENIGQAFAMTATGNADIGFVALSSVIDYGEDTYWLAPRGLYAPIRQDAVLLRPERAHPAAAAFLDYLQSDAARNVMAARGYQVP